MSKLTIQNYNKLNDTEFTADREYFVESIKENVSNYWITVRNLMGFDNETYIFEINRYPKTKADFSYRINMVGTSNVMKLTEGNMSKQDIVEYMIYLINKFKK
jgi:hypothetical protein